MMDPFDCRYITTKDAYLEEYSTSSNPGLTWPFAEMQKEKKHSWHSRPYEYAWIREALEFHPFNDLAVLDAGCGAGYPGPYVVSDCANVRQVHAMDIDPKLLEQRVGHGEITWSVGDLTKYQTSERYDAITCISTLEHIPRWKKTLKNFHNLLDPGGLLLLTLDIYVGDEQPEEKYSNMTKRTPKKYILELFEAGFRLPGHVQFEVPENRIDCVNSAIPFVSAEELTLEIQPDLLTYRIAAIK